MKTQYFLLIILLLCLTLSRSVIAQSADQLAKERKFYTIQDVPLPDDVILEVGGMDFIDDNRLAVCTRRGEIWIIQDPDQKGTAKPTFTRFASGLHEPLGLAYHEGSIYVNQRAELTKITDTNKDGKADLFETVVTWPISGNYHEYAYGPLFLPNGDMLVTLNLSWVGRGESLTKWRGWMMKVTKDGKLIPYAAGMRSPAGFGFNATGDVFYGENQGDWISSGRITHLEEGDFAGHPASLKWSGEKNSPMKGLTRDQFPDSIGSMHAFGKKVAQLKQPAVIFPHTLMGISTSDIVTIPTDEFGPFKGQLLVGDQGHSKIMRAYLEKVNGEYQGACFPFLEGFSSGILRLVWSQDNSLFVGMTSRGWAATGRALYGLQRVRWNGTTPFGIKAMKAMSNGFELEFTKPVNKRVAENADFRITGFTYAYHKKYGSPVIDQRDCPVVKKEVSPDGLSVRLYVSGLREGYVHQLDVGDLRSQGGESLLHHVAYYTLNAIPEGSAEDQEMIAKAQHSDHHHTMPGDVKGGCGDDPGKNTTAMPSDWGEGPDVQITIGTKPGLKFDQEVFEVQEGSKVKLVFNNNDDMLHNLLIVKPGKEEAVGKMALNMGLSGTELGFIPNSPDLLWTTCLLQPESSQAIYFIAPKAGEYPYICSYPGHYLVMKGVMKVVPKRNL